MGVVKKIVGAVAGPVLGFIIGGTKGAIQGLGNAATAFFGGPLAAAVSIGATLLSSSPKSPRALAASVDRLNVSIDLRAARKMAIGRTAFATDLRDQEWSTDQVYLHRFVVAASHKVSAISEVWFDDKLAWTSTGGVQSAFVGYLTVTAILEGTAANAINIGPRMGGTRRYTGCAYVYFRYKLTGNDKKAQSPFASVVPSRMTIIGDGIPVYDPRLDSTVGGSGSQRASDQTTWTYTAAAGRNAALGLLTYLLGWRIQNPSNGTSKLAVGKGIAPARINFASFITAANICDETVAIAAGGSEPRYRSDGLISEADDLSTVADNFKAAMNATLDDVDGKFRLSILYNDLAAPIGTLTANDVLGEFSWDQTPPLQDTINVIRWSYTDPSTASLFQMVDGPEVAIASPDGIERSQTVPLPLVQSPSQGQRLIKLRLQRALFPGTFSATFQATAWKFQKGDVIRFSFDPLGFALKLFRIVDMTIQVDGTVPMILREEHADIYLAANDNAAVIVGTAPTTYNPLLQPILQDLSNLNGITDRQSSDGWLSGVEKPQARINYDALVNQRNALQTRYVALGSPSDITPARNAAFDQIATLTVYLNSLAPAWDIVSAGDTVIPDAAAYRQQWDDATNDLEEFAAAITGRPGTNGTNGLPGAPGADGQTSYVHFAYADSADGTTNFTAGAPGARSFVGVYTDFTVADSNSPAAYSWSRYRGIDGLNGSNGTPGAPGSNGQTSYIHLAYADSADGSVNFTTEDAAGRSYIGTYTDFSAPDSGSYSAYTWSRFRGLDGSSGTPGAPGANGQTSYVHFAYSDSADGSVNFTAAAAGDRQFVGTYTDFTEADSGNYLAYTWSRFRGLDGSNGTPGAPGVNGQTTYVHIAYSSTADGSSNFSISDPTGRAYIGTLTDFTLGDSGNYGDYVWSLVKGSDGANGAPGAPGAPGVSPKALSLSVTSMTVQAYSSGVTKPGQLNRYSTVRVMQGTIDITAGASVTVSPAGSIDASYDGGASPPAVVVTRVESSGYIDVVATHGGNTLPTIRIQVNRVADAAAPMTSTSTGASLLASPSSASYDGTGVANKILTLQANSSGALTATAQGEYTADGGGQGNRLYRMAAMLEYQGGSGGGWNSMGAEVNGTTAQTIGSDDPVPGSLQITKQVTGLSPNGFYQIRFNGRKLSGSAGVVGTISGTFEANQ